MVESGCEEIMAGAETENVAFLVVGDPFGCAHTPHCSVDSHTHTHTLSLV